MSDMEDSLREVMRAADAAAPVASAFRFVPPNRPNVRTRRTWVAAVAAAACVIAIAIAISAVALTRGSDRRIAAPPGTTAAVPAPTLTCPQVAPAPPTSASSYALPPPPADALPEPARLAPTDTPIHAVICSYVNAHSNRPPGNRERRIDTGLANIPGLMAWAPPGTGPSCPLYSAVTDSDLYLVGLMYPNGSLWISAPDNHCVGASNGQFTTRFHVATTVKSALDTGAWPAPAPATPCNVPAGRVGQQEHMVPAGAEKVTACRGIDVSTARTATTSQMQAVTTALNALATTAGGIQFSCAGPAYVPATSYTLTFTYPVGPPVTVEIFEPCTPAIHNGNLQAADATTVLPIVSQILASANVVTSAPAETPSGSLSRCASGTVAVSLVPGLSGATGEHGQVFAVENVGQSRCMVEGYPTVRLFDRSGAEVPFSFTQGGGAYMTTKQPSPITLSPGAKAYFIIAKYRCDVHEAVRAASAQIIVPGQAAPTLLPLSTGQSTIADLSYCDGNGTPDPGNKIAISPLRPDGSSW